MTEMTKNEMEEILLAHEKGELEEDLDATMATLVANPHYELPTLGYAFDGYDAVREAYSRIMPGTRTRNVAAKMRVHAIDSNTLVREAHVSFNTRSGQRVNGNYIVVMSFDPEQKLISGERMYMDTNFAAMMSENLGPDFADVPGVTKLSDVAPTIDRHDAYEVAERKGITIN
ncbi:hypothetical protein [Mycolicibacterium fortuitum]|uniref:SnoaL-like domain-containing protein n=1 Tax=Mycolicibacterium fortuitum subsp. fortuitum DSM 46621 = ATCC 6841 = JCM 6387 TaxID=1214102 RepID=K0UJG7_MYCFO|nr:hypothetical protein [Mycolicibacterium fortuitum]AIY48003.1 hypothetical protein G155_23410 [Mycobacterium sp. VKM Ac-1817D]CRL82802.1 hypothetical protein CPGR_06029 [Mycolicibacter nonchromogenicus]EJZ06946.1 hypothetical protein MFORT_27186 [Mycolicibacterium fortuitum subsp. fortuitum DSM 46621 = ATCC 6841 = JCM 6387]WEV31609.1 hypothetical protein OMF10_23700 [Mycolicibacterium fortuitum]CRL52772.1 hypothetical protein CPGR_00047 [Mycolicibacterium fortuitum subsp. fortuitum DSM 46621